MTHFPGMFHDCADIHYQQQREDGGDEDDADSANTDVCHVMVTWGYPIRVCQDTISST